MAHDRKEQEGQHMQRFVKSIRNLILGLDGTGPQGTNPVDRLCRCHSLMNEIGGEEGAGSAFACSAVNRHAFTGGQLFRND